MAEQILRPLKTSLRKIKGGEAFMIAQWWSWICIPYCIPYNAYKCIFLKMFCNILNAALQSGVQWSPWEMRILYGQHCMSLCRAVFRDWLFHSPHAFIPWLSLLLSTRSRLFNYLSRKEVLRNEKEKCFWGFFWHHIRRTCG